MVKSNIFRGVGRSTELVMTKGKGSWMYTECGRKLLDFTCGIAVTNVGHCHPHVVKAVQEQVETLVHGQVNIGYHQPMLTLTERLLPILPKGLDSMFYSTTGSEAVENAVKLARTATKKPNIIVFQGSYHGRTIGAMSWTTSKTIYRAGFGPLPGGCTVVPFPYAAHLPVKEPEQLSAWCLEQVELALKQRTAPSETAAMLIEPILGEGGYVAPPKSFMAGLRQICTDNGILLIADEVQCGFGRTGTNFAIDGQLDTIPDIMVVAKGIANGFPLSGVASRKELTDTQAPGSMGGTYAGNAVSCAAAIATQEVFQMENILDNTVARGGQFLKGLERLKSSGRYPILDVRGVGLMTAMEFDSSSPKVKYGTAANVAKACLNNDMLVLTTSVFETLRFMPPLNISQEDMQAGLERLEQALEETFCK